MTTINQQRQIRLTITGDNSLSRIHDRVIQLGPLKELSQHEAGAAVVEAIGSLLLSGESVAHVTITLE